MQEHNNLRAVGNTTKTDRETWLKEHQEQIYATLEQVMPGMAALIDELVGRRERINEALNVFAQELGKTLNDIHEDFDEYIDSVRSWGNYGWTLFPLQTVAPFLNAPTDKKSANKSMQALCTPTAIKELWGFILPLSHKCDVMEAQSCFYNKEYKACALILIARIEALLIRCQPRNKNRKIGNQAVRKFGDAHVSELELRKVHYNALCYAGLLQALKAVYRDSENFKKQPEIINRHFLVHGMLTRPVKRMDCIQLLLIYYNLTMYV